MGRSLRRNPAVTRRPEADLDVALRGPGAGHWSSLRRTSSPSVYEKLRGARLASGVFVLLRCNKPAACPVLHAVHYAAFARGTKPGAGPSFRLPPGRLRNHRASRAVASRRREKLFTAAAQAGWTNPAPGWQANSARRCCRSPQAAGHPPGWWWARPTFSPCGGWSFSSCGGSSSSAPESRRRWVWHGFPSSLPGRCCHPLAAWSGPPELGFAPACRLPAPRAWAPAPVPAGRRRLPLQASDSEAVSANSAVADSCSTSICEQGAGAADTGNGMPLPRYTQTLEHRQECRHRAAATAQIRASRRPCPFVTRRNRRGSRFWWLA